jgi:RNA-directed DNA polymerase
MPRGSKVTYYENVCQKSNLKIAWKNLHKRPQSVGLDEVTIADFRTDLDENLEKLSIALKSGKYKPVKLLPHMLKKPEGGYRVLRIPAVRDRVVQRAILNEISKPLDDHFHIDNNGVSYAYVSGGGVNKAAEKIVKYWEQGYDYVYKSDIIKFFDNINKKVLLEKISKSLGTDQSLMPLIEDHLNCAVENIKKVADYDPEIYNPKPLLGLAQGSPLSPVFANVYLAEFDQAMLSRKLKMVRYADDLIIMGKTLAAAEATHAVVEEELKKLGLQVHALKVQGKQLPAVGHSKPKYSEARRCQDVEFLGLTFKSKKIYPAGRSYQNATKSVRFAAYDRGNTFVKRLVSIDARVFGWSSAYSFTEQEPAKIAVLDQKLDETLRIMIQRQGLKIKQSKTPHKVLGIRNYSASLQEVINNKTKM